MRLPVPPALVIFLVATAAALSACGSSVDAPNQPPPATATEAGGKLETSPIMPEDATRWGYHPGRLSGGRDPSPTFVALPPGYVLETFVTGLEQPTSLAFTPDGRLLIAEQRGAIRVVEDGALQPEPFISIDVFSPDASDSIVELGLVGIAVDPAFSESGAVFVYYTAAAPQQRTVLARLRDEGGMGVDLTEIFSLDAQPACCHIAGSLRFAPDGTLFVTVGDHQMEPASQDLSNPYGAILRINADGSAPADNPFVGSAGVDPRIYAYGLRNPFDVAINPVDGRIFATENGFLGQDAIIEVFAGGNYGWPGSDLAVPLEEIVQPLQFYHRPLGPAGIELYSGGGLPAYAGSLLFCQFHEGGALHALTFAADGGIASDTIIALGCTSDLQTAPDGAIYFLDYVSGTVYRLSGPA